VPDAIARWRQELPSPLTGLGRLEELILQSLHAGRKHPVEIFKFVAAADTPPQFWGDTTLWAKINALAERELPLVEINGSLKKLPQWQSDMTIKAL